MSTNSINVGLLGGSFCCPNFGVGALTISQCLLLDKIAQELNIRINLICYESIIQTDYLDSSLFPNVSITLDTHTYDIRIMREKLSRHDVIIDLYGGVSSNP